MRFLQLFGSVGRLHGRDAKHHDVREIHKDKTCVGSRNGTRHARVHMNTAHARAIRGYEEITA